MARLLWLADVLRAASLTVHEYDGWRTRGGDTYAPLGVIIHETQGSPSSTDAGELRTLAITGSNSAPAPIAQLYLSRSGEWWTVASGRCNHVSEPGTRHTPPRSRPYASSWRRCEQTAPGQGWTRPANPPARWADAA